MRNLIIKNGEIYVEGGILYNQDIIVSDGIIKTIGKFDSLEHYTEIDASGKKILPGFIDIHVHGGCGYDVMDSEYKSINGISIHLAKHGVTSFLTTTMTMDKKIIKEALKNIKSTIEIGTEGATVIGAYVEGPFISHKFKGAQNADFIMDPDISVLDEFIKASEENIKVIVLAPEKDLDGSFARYASSKGIKVALGHTNATFSEMENAITYDASISTHTYNGMRGVNHREPGALGAVMVDERIYCEIICDFIHVHPAAVKILLNIKGIDKVILVSDGMSACGFSDGEYSFGGQIVKVEGNEARINNGSLAGSLLTLNKAVKNILSLGIPLEDAIKMASLNPARAIGIDESKGSIKVGKDADLVILDKNLDVNITIVGGKVVYKK